jgi:hypothetical protein
MCPGKETEPRAADCPRIYARKSRPSNFKESIISRVIRSTIPYIKFAHVRGSAPGKVLVKHNNAPVVKGRGAGAGGVVVLSPSPSHISLTKIAQRGSARHFKVPQNIFYACANCARANITFAELSRNLFRAAAIANLVKSNVGECASSISTGPSRQKNSSALQAPD